MYEGYPVELCMTQNILKGDELDQRMHYCKVIEYDEDAEVITLLLRGEGVTVISLDAIYSCKIMDGERYTKCEGRIMERYLNKQGHMLVFKIENGFYKNSVN